MEENIAEVVLDHFLNKYEMAGNMINDISIDELEFLDEEEPIYNLFGERVSKSYYAPNGKECIRIVYGKNIQTFIFEGTEYPNVWQGFTKKFEYIRWDGTIGRTKYKRPYRFRLEPIIENGEVVGFTSRKMRKAILEEQREIANN